MHKNKGFGVEEKIRVGIINYLNTRPLLYGLQFPPITEKIELIEDVPAKLAELLLNDQIDVGLVPVAITQKLPQYYINGNYCIGAIGNVASVCVFSQVPLERVEKIHLDYQSRSSVALCRWLIQNHWKIQPEIVDARNESFLNEIKGTTAGLVIGDRALQQRTKFEYIYDLAGEWKNATGLPFVFAAWVSTRKLPDHFITEFDKANAYGLDHLDEVIARIPEGIYDLKKYYSQDLSYILDEEKRKGLERFLQILATPA
ncbi:menaquinone biosynthesis protein [Niabella sp. CC-SYL272]|uniref:menaquinone biosynthetic enzyme MqnA/MqnD family protein n=1 Tax=Niabella agricola TaxID=2891571 RepID=UPI001F444339|nr:menaquinone biosynthesis protein [Niabella agricola]MCF3108479.1 menaquinone biosynthesis protein [Niabella agricola]